MLPAVRSANLANGSVLAYLIFPKLAFGSFAFAAKKRWNFVQAWPTKKTKYKARKATVTPTTDSNPSISTAGILILCKDLEMIYALRCEGHLILGTCDAEQNEDMCKMKKRCCHFTSSSFFTRKTFPWIERIGSAEFSIRLIKHLIEEVIIYIRLFQYENIYPVTIPSTVQYPVSRIAAGMSSISV